MPDPGNLTINSPIRFARALVMPAANRLILTRNFDLETYSRAFGGDVAGFTKALQALFYFSDHVTFDMSGRRVDLTDPIDVAASQRVDQLSPTAGCCATAR
jgi:hypothetical protein